MRASLSSFIVHRKLFEEEKPCNPVSGRGSSPPGPSRVLHEKTFDLRQVGKMKQSMPTVSSIDAVLSEKIVTTNLYSLATL